MTCPRPQPLIYPEFPDLPDLTCECGHQPENHTLGYTRGPGLCLITECPCGAYRAADDTILHADEDA